MHLRNVRVWLANGDVRRSWREYALAWIRRPGHPRLRIHGLSFGGFASFSEFHGQRYYTSHDDLRFFTEFDFPVGPVLDVGANHGVTSLLLAQRYPGRTIHAFEPHPAVAGLIAENAKFNRLNNVVVHELAVCDRAGRVPFLALRQGTANSRLVRGLDVPGAIEVTAIRLDEFAREQGMDVIGVLKVDTEGHEAQVFAGAMGLLRRQAIRVIHFEVCPGLTRLAGLDPGLATAILAQNGYRLFRYRAGHLVRVDAADALTADFENWVAVSTTVKV